jgi:ubiquinone/menaquinone biosynthesis C-methylase UbiE
METYARMFVRFKIICDPMFPRLADFVSSPKQIIDIGTGYGVPVNWLLELYPEARGYGLDPDEERVLVASWAIGDQGTVQVGRAPGMPDIPEQPDTALILDMIHLISDDDLVLTLQRLYTVLKPGGRLIIRLTIPAEGKYPLGRWIEYHYRMWFQGMKPWFRSSEKVERLLSESGFVLKIKEPAAPGREETWFVAEKKEI